ncbi:hypothetical protein AB6V46_15610, partial [Stenotrophomonas maltophilia]|uniref:hypothetical protein n=1 Tax=Stenotrophomonas maltophilia TaxID=40324 RepID=UPI0034E2173D
VFLVGCVVGGVGGGWGRFLFFLCALVLSLGLLGGGGGGGFVFFFFLFFFAVWGFGLASLVCGVCFFGVWVWCPFL